MIDLHCHILPGIDDGPSTLLEAAELARAASADGTKTVVATPHVSWDYRNEVQTITDLTALVNDHLRSEGIGVEVLPGAEVAATFAAELDVPALTSLSLGGSGWILVEPPFGPVDASGVERVFASIMQRGHRVVIAHPERCPAFQGSSDVIRRLVEAGAATSVTASSLSGRFGRTVQRSARRLLDEGLVHNVASDAHDAVNRSPRLASELERSGCGWLTEWAAQQVAAALIHGEPIPGPPPAPPARRFWQRPIGLNRP